MIKQDGMVVVGADDFGEKWMNKIDLDKKMIGIMKVGMFYPILMHKIYYLQNKMIIKMFNFDLIKDSIAINKDIMTRLMSKCAIHHIT